MKTDLIPPEKMRAVLIAAAKARLLNETGNFICTTCWDYLETIRIKDLPDKPKCPRCGSFALGMLKVEEEKALPLIEKEGPFSEGRGKTPSPRQTNCGNNRKIRQTGGSCLALDGSSFFRHSRCFLKRA